MPSKFSQPVTRVFSIFLVLLIALAVLPASPAAADTTLERYPTNTTTSGGSGDAWTSPESANANDNNYTSVSVSTATPRLSETLQARGFGFSIPTDATINGITVEIGRYSSVSSQRIQDSIVQMVKAGTQVGTNRAAGGVNWPTSEENATYGGTGDLWGTTWTPAQINDSTFGVNLQAYNPNNSSTRTAYVDYIRVTVEYTPAPTGTTLVVSAVSGTFGDAATLSATLTTTAGSTPVVGRPVVFTLNGAAACTDPATDAAGLATCSATLTSDVNTYATGVGASHAAGGGYAASSDTDSLTITARPLTVTAENDTKVYDGNTASTVMPVVTGTLAAGNTATFSQSYNTKDVGTGKTITPAVAFTSGKASNYAITLTPATNGVITARPITVTAVTASRTYDGSIVSSPEPTLTGSLAPGDAATRSQTYDTKHVGTGKTLTPAISFTAGSASNYAITLTPVNTGTITARPITVTAVTGTKVYDGTNTSAGTPTVTGGTMVDTATWTQVYANKNVGTGKTLNPSGVIFDGNSGNNYNVNFVSVSTGVITARPITVTAVTDSREYDSATASSGTPTITSGSLATGDAANWSQAFANKNAGTGKSIVPSGAVVDGNSGNNYNISFVNVSTGVIAKRPLTLTAVATTKVYDGTTASPDLPILDGSLAGSDTATRSQAFDNKNAGSAKTLTPSIAISDGNGGNNYLVSVNSVSTGVITAKPITVTAVGDTKVYDGDTSSGETPIAAGLIAPDTGTWTQSFDSPAAGTSKVLTPGGSAGSNYAPSFVNAAGVITPKPITVTALTDTKVFDGDTSSVQTPNVTGLIAPDIGTFTQSFDSASAGASKTLTPSGSAGSNYAPNFVTASGSITPKPITVTAAADTKVYDGTTDSSAAPSATGLVGSDTGTWTQTFDSPGAGSSKTLTPSGSAGSNYAPSFVTASGTITPKPITVTAVTVSKVYDGTTAAAGDPTVSGLVGSDTGTFTQAFASRNAGTVNLVPSGSAGPNYAPSFVQVSGTITPKPITVTANPLPKEYDGATSSPVVPTISGGLAAGDTSGFTQVYDDRNAGTGKLLTPSGAVVDGNGGLNYTVTLEAVNTGVITPRPVTISAAADVKVYDGTTASVVTPVFVSGALAPDDTASLSQTFDTKDAGIGKTLTPDGNILDGNSGQNYVVTFTSADIGDITPKPIAVTADDLFKKVGSADPALTFTADPALIAPDLFSGTLARETGETVGTYAINQGTLSAGGNYTITFTPGTFTINTKDAQSIVVTKHAPSSGVAGTTFTVTATASSGLPVLYSASGACTVVGNVFTITGGGTCTVHYNQAGDAVYNPAPEITEIVTAIAQMRFYLPMMSR